MLHTAKSLQGFEVHARDGELGKVVDFYFDDEHWALRYLVVETGSWLSSRKVLIATSALQGAVWEEKLLSIDLSRGQVGGSPGIDTEKPVTRKDETDLRNYYSWPAYWLGAGYINGTPLSAGGTALGIGMMPPVGAIPPLTEPEVRVAPEGDRHLRNAREVVGYRIEATDGDIGHVEDFLVDDETWDIRYFVIDTRNWLPGRKVVVFPDLVTQVRWSESRVHIDLTRERIKAAPVYDPAKSWDIEYATQLDFHYGRRDKRARDSKVA